MFSVQLKLQKWISVDVALNPVSDTTVRTNRRKCATESKVFQWYEGGTGLIERAQSSHIEPMDRFAIIVRANLHFHMRTQHAYYQHPHSTSDYDSPPMVCSDTHESRSRCITLREYRQFHFTLCAEALSPHIRASVIVWGVFMLIWFLLLVAHKAQINCTESSQGMRGLRETTIGIHLDCHSEWVYYLNWRTR